MTRNCLPNVHINKLSVLKNWLFNSTWSVTSYTTWLVSNTNIALTSHIFHTIKSFSSTSVRTFLFPANKYLLLFATFSLNLLRIYSLIWQFSNSWCDWQWNWNKSNTNFNCKTAFTYNLTVYRIWQLNNCYYWASLTL